MATPTLHDTSISCPSTVAVWRMAVQAWQHGGVALDVAYTDVTLPLLRGRYLLPSGLRRAPQLQALTPVLPVTP